MTIVWTAERLKSLVAEVLARAGCEPPENEWIAERLVESNLVGHDSHGVIRAADYVEWLQRGMVRANQEVEVVYESGPIAVVDGHLGFGQSIGRQAMELAGRMCRRHGVAVVALRNSGHLGRIGDWPEQLAGAGLVSLHLVNTSGFGLLVAPHGGIDRRLSANPFAAGVPVPDGPPIILDISTCAIAEGKIKVARNRGTRVPAGCLIDAQGRPTDDPQRFYADPPGAILPLGGHKGYGLSIVCELLAGALTGGGCTSRQETAALANNMLSIVLDPARIPNPLGFAAEVERLVAWVKSARCAAPDGEILVPGELEYRTRQHRLAHGIPLDDATCQQLHDAARSL